jgi:hypothetical protein
MEFSLKSGIAGVLTARHGGVNVGGRARYYYGAHPVVRPQLKS